MLRNLLSIVGGVFIGINVIKLAQGYAARLHPMPVDLDVQDPIAYMDFVQSIPSNVFALIIAAHGLGVLIAVLITGRIALTDKRRMAQITVFVMTVLTLMFLFMVPNPKWVILADFSVVVIVGLLASLIYK